MRNVEISPKKSRTIFFGPPSIPYLFERFEFCRIGTGHTFECMCKSLNSLRAPNAVYTKYQMNSIAKKKNHSRQSTTMAQTWNERMGVTKEKHINKSKSLHARLAFLFSEFLISYTTHTHSALCFVNGRAREIQSAPFPF